MREYHIFENRVSKRVRVHDSACAHVVKRNEGPSQNRWHGPLTSRREALRFALNLKYQNTQECKHCLYG